MAGKYRVGRADSRRCWDTESGVLILRASSGLLEFPVTYIWTRRPRQQQKMCTCLERDRQWKRRCAIYLPAFINHFFQNRILFLAFFFFRFLSWQGRCQKGCLWIHDWQRKVLNIIDKFSTCPSVKFSYRHTYISQNENKFNIYWMNFYFNNIWICMILRTYGLRNYFLIVYCKFTFSLLKLYYLFRLYLNGWKSFKHR